MSPNVLAVHELTVRYGGLVANDSVTITVGEGEVVGLIGPNGAGKTSFVDAVTGFTSSTGSIELDGRRIEALPPHARTRAGLARTWQSVELFRDLTVRENLLVGATRISWRSALLDLVRPSRPPVPIEEALGLLDLDHLAERLPGELSLGHQKVAGIARALASQPSVVCLDEPAAGLDSSESLRLGEQIRRLPGAGVSVLLIDHDMDLVLETCDRVYVMVFGRIVAVGPPAIVRNDENVINAYLGEPVAGGAEHE